VLLGSAADADVARRLRAACVSSEHPTATELCTAIEFAVKAVAR